MYIIKKFEHDQQKELTDFVLEIQNGEFGLGFKNDEQIDLINTYEFYKNGGFWVAEVDSVIVGCIGLQQLNSNIGVLRKMFVDKNFRGKESGIAQKLFEHLIIEALKLNFKKILLDTPSIAVASHRFYQRNGFKEIEKSSIPEEYIFPDRNSKIFELDLT